MTAEINLTDLSRTLSHALRHEPWLYELELDDDGWASLDDVLTALRSERPQWQHVTAADLERMIAQSEKQRHEIQPTRIRAIYGHSLPGKLQRVSAVPPDVLYHGTAPEIVPAIRASGLLPMSRQFVHLSADEATAVQVGKRKSKQPVILRITALDAHLAGVPFYAGNDQVWLADHVPAQFILATD
ncbi:MAG TPA: RNA 2'-phosphotransferase [Pirellulaceae bacterium]|nr:RNA 2'-phosphotransferase [Pirellulaceae bacterium]